MGSDPCDGEPHIVPIECEVMISVLDERELHRKHFGLDGCPVFSHGAMHVLVT